MTEPYYPPPPPEFEDEKAIDHDNTRNAWANEGALIGAVLRDGDIFERASENLKTDDFHFTPYAWVWEAFDTLHNQDLHIDIVTVADELRRKGRLEEFTHALTTDNLTTKFYGMQAIMSLREGGDPRTYLTYCANIRDYANKRRIVKILNESAVGALNGRRAKDVLSDLMTKIASIEIFGAQDEYTSHIGDAVSEAYDWAIAAANGKLLGVITGIYKLDTILSNLFAGNFYIIAARPKQGKTGFLGTVALFVSRVLKKRVVIFSLEMSKMQVAFRLIAQVAELDLDRVIKGQLEPWEWDKFKTAADIVHGLPIIINDMSSIDIAQIRQTSRKIKAEGGLDLIIMDYVQLAGADDGKYDRRDLEVAAVSRGLKHLARELDVPVLAAAQLSRKVEERNDKRPMLSDLRESGSLEQDADAVMFIYRPEHYENGKRPGEADIIVAAQRNGPVGTAEVKFQANTVRFGNLERDEVQEPAWQKRADMGDD